MKYSSEEAAEFKEKTKDESVKFAFNALRWIVYPRMGYISNRLSFKRTEHGVGLQYRRLN